MRALCRLPVHAPLTFGLLQHLPSLGLRWAGVHRDKLVIVTNRYLFGTYVVRPLVFRVRKNNVRRRNQIRRKTDGWGIEFVQSRRMLDSTIQLRVLPPSANSWPFIWFMTSLLNSSREKMHTGKKGFSCYPPLAHKVAKVTTRK